MSGLVYPFTLIDGTQNDCKVLSDCVEYGPHFVKYGRIRAFKGQIKNFLGQCHCQRFWPAVLNRSSEIRKADNVAKKAFGKEGEWGAFREGKKNIAKDASELSRMFTEIERTSLIMAVRPEFRYVATPAEIEKRSTVREIFSTFNVADVRLQIGFVRGFDVTDRIKVISPRVMNELPIKLFFFKFAAVKKEIEIVNGRARVTNVPKNGAMALLYRQYNIVGAPQQKIIPLFSVLTDENKKENEK